jgi:hypothetical protein
MTHDSLHHERQDAPSPPATNVPPELLQKIADAVTNTELAQRNLDEAEKADTAAEKARKHAAEHLGKCDEDYHKSADKLGRLLLEAKELHASVKSFDVFLERHVVGLKRSRAYDYMRIAKGKVTHEKLTEDARERKARSRAGKKAEGAAKKARQAALFAAAAEPSLEPPSDSVTPPPVTENNDDAPTSAETMKAKFAAMADADMTDTTVADKTDALGDAIISEEETSSTLYLRRFKEAAVQYLNQLDASDLEEARAFILNEEWKPTRPYHRANGKSPEAS